jgi:hypothetical protein
MRYFFLNAEQETSGDRDGTWRQRSTLRSGSAGGTFKINDLH